MKLLQTTVYKICYISVFVSGFNSAPSLGQHRDTRQEEVDHDEHPHWSGHYGATGHLDNIGAATNVEQRKEHNIHKRYVVHMYCYDNHLV